MNLRVSILAVVLILLSFGCAKDVGEDNVPKIASTISVSLETFTSEGLRYLQEKAPEQVEPTLADLNAVIAQISLYNDGSATIGDVANSLSILIERVNDRFDLIEDEETARLFRIIASLSRLVEIYFVSVEIPEEAVAYANAASAGIQAGIADYEASLVSVEINRLLGYDASKLVTNLPMMEVIR